MKDNKLFVFLITAALIFGFVCAAFAADVTTANRHSSLCVCDETEVQTDDVAKVTVYLRDSENDVVSGGSVYVASRRGDTDSFYSDDDMENELSSAGYADPVYVISADEMGKAEFYVNSAVAGSSDVYVGVMLPVSDETSLYRYAVGEADADDAGVISNGGEISLDFEAADAETITLVAAETRDGDNETGTVSGKYVLTGDNVRPVANNLDYHRLTFRVTDENGVPVEGELVEFDVNQASGRLSVEEAYTDNIGEVEVKVYSTESFMTYKSRSTTYSKFELTAEFGDEENVVILEFGAPEPYELHLSMGTPINVNLAKGTTGKYFKFYVYDSEEQSFNYYGLGQDQLEADVDIEVVEEPDDSDIEDGIYLTKGSTTQKIYMPELEAEGYYAVRISLDNGDYADITFNVAEQGDITEMEFEYDWTGVELGGSTDIPSVTLIDASNVEKELDEDELERDCVFSVSNIEMGTVAANGVFTASDDDDNKGSVYVTCIYEPEDITGTTRIYVGDVVTGIKLQRPAVTRVGETADMEIQLVDADGNIVGVDDGKKLSLTYLVMDKPEGAHVSVGTSGMFTSDLKEEGAGDIEVESSMAGDVRIGVILSEGSNRFYAEQTVTFGDRESGFAEEVRMFIGIPGYTVDGEMRVMDGVPFIDGSRTYVPLRAAAEVFNAAIGWNADTQEVTLDNKAKEVTVKVGSSIVKVKDSPSIMADGMPQIREGRTYVPFRVIGEIFGAFVEPVLNEDDSVSGVSFRMFEEDED